MDVAAGMQRSATKQNLSQAAQKNVDMCAHYIHNHQAYLKYEDCLESGYPIASGVIEDSASA